MKRGYITAIAAAVLLAAGGASAAAAAPNTGTKTAPAPFGCDAGPGVTCFFKLFLGPRTTRIVQLKSGMKVGIPGVDIGKDRYCVSANAPPLPTCGQIVINATYNH
ncbi:MAG TPA: hypothetical protein VKX28_16720 [Xanthobacteraceae bacterium]|nr:hypothetical protein [Xanthobacteraceae bacterium]